MSEDGMLSEEQGERLLDIARKTVKYYIENGEKPDIESEGFLEEERGVFTTIRKGDELRGCIGFPRPIETLLQAVQDSAVQAALRDPRFEDITEDEIEEVVFEISVLTEPEDVGYEGPEELCGSIDVGTDGLIVSSGFHTGLLLPQVAEDNGWDTEEFLSQTCLKAGLSEDAWRERELIVKKFRAQVFEEEG